MPIASGATIGPYKVDRELGRGGMGVVFLAHDTRLGRTAALKALPEDVASDPDRLQRFEREARVLASLNHPNIAAIYGLEESGGRRYLALEHIEGETLADRLQRGPLPLHEAIDIGIQIAAGMEAAHDGGVVHRDLKPANVMITPDDHVKILDFGLAKGKVVSDESGLAKSPAMVDSPTLSSPTLPHSPTIVTPATLPGVILGTASYLSPEQARGKAVDRRTDIWSFGCVLFECLTGRRAFEGETVSDTIAGILAGEVDWASLPKSTPPRVRELLERCLTKDPKRRLRDIGDARLTLEEIKSGRYAAPADVPVGAAPAARRRTPLLLALGVLAGAILGAAAWSALRPSAHPSKTGPIHLAVTLPPGLLFVGGAITPGGEAMVTIGVPRAAAETEPARPRLYVRRRDQGAFTPLRGTEGAASVLVSPDGRWIAFASAPSPGQLRFSKIPVDGSSPPVGIGPYHPSWGFDAAWLRSGDFIIGMDDGTKFVRLSSDGTASAPRAFELPSINGRFRVQNPPLPGDRGVFLGVIWYERGVYCQGIAVLDLKANKVTMLIRDGGSPQYSPTGHLLLFTRQSTLFAVPFDVGRLRVRGEPVAILGDLRPQRQGLHAGFSMASNGMIAYAPAIAAGSDRRLIVVDPNGKVGDWSGERRAWEYMITASRDGRSVAGCINNADQITEIWISERGRSTSFRLPVPPGADRMVPCWSRDGKQIAFFQVSQSGEDGLYVSSVDGASPARRVALRSSPSMYLLPTSWSPDGATIVANLVEGNKVTLCSVAASAGPGSPSTPKRLFSDGANRRGGDVSPDGKLVTYQSDETGRWESYVCAMSGDALVGRPLLVSNGGGVFSTWGPDGQLYYLTPENKVMSVPITSAPMLRATAPTVRWDLAALRVPYNFPGGPLFDILPDGSLLGVQVAQGDDAPTHFDVILNFDEELKRRMQAARK